MGSFSHLALSSLEFPEEILPAIGDAYLHRYTAAFVRNPYLGRYGYTMAQQFLAEGSEISLLTLLENNNVPALEAILDSDTIEHTIISHILAKWDLCVDDQMRLANRDMSQDTAALFFHTPGICTMAKYEASERAGSGYSHSHFKPWERPHYEGHTRNRTYNYLPERERKQRGDRSVGVSDLETTLPVLTSRYRDARPLSGIMAQGLGTKGELAINTWLNFFGLTESDPNVPLKAAMSSARALANAALRD
jgi:hypothetical protein